MKRILVDANVLVSFLRKKLAKQGSASYWTD